MTTNVLAVKTPRESAGAASARTFDFQIHVAVARVLERHGSVGPYFVLFDHFDDFVLVEGDEARPDLSFFQVKSRADGAWTASRLAKRSSKGDLPRSIIGKAYYNLDQFGAAVRQATIVSNQPLQAKFASGDKVTVDDADVLLSTLCTADSKVLQAAMEADFSTPLDPRHATVLRFERSPLNLQSYRNAVLGQVTSFVGTLAPDAAAVAKPFYEALVMEATRCTGHTARATDLADLKGRKGIGRADVDALIAEVKSRGKTPIEWWPAVQGELDAAALGARAQQRLYTQCLAYWTARQRGTSEALALSRDIRAAVEHHAGLVEDAVLTSATALALTRSLSAPTAAPYTLQSALVVELMELDP